MRPSIDPSDGARIAARFSLICADAAADVAGDEESDRLDLACMLAIALAERDAGRGALPDLIGLDADRLRYVAARYFPTVALPDLDVARAPSPPDQEALATLIAWRGGVADRAGLVFAAIIARRAREPRHLWEDLGLPSRPALTALMRRRFPKLAALNSANMRWKKFFYRQICSDSGFALCLAPSCSECDERAECFPPANERSGEIQAV